MLVLLYRTSNDKAAVLQLFYKTIAVLLLRQLLIGRDDFCLYHTELTYGRPDGTFKIIINIPISAIWGSSAYGRSCSVIKLALSIET